MCGLSLWLFDSFLDLVAEFRGEKEWLGVIDLAFFVEWAFEIEPCSNLVRSVRAFQEFVSRNTKLGGAAGQDLEILHSGPAPPRMVDVCTVGFHLCERAVRRMRPIADRRILAVKDNEFQIPFLTVLTAFPTGVHYLDADRLPCRFWFRLVDRERHRKYVRWLAKPK